MEGAGFYRLYRYNASSERIFIGETEDTSLTATGLTVGSSYAFCVSALTPDKSSESSFSATVRAACESVPAIPTELTLTPTATGVLTVSWAPVDGAARYYVAKYGSDKTYQTLGETTECSFAVTGLSAGSHYYLRVIAETANGDSQSKPAYVDGYSESIPAKPTGLAAETSAPNTIRLSWPAVPEAGSYRVYRYVSSVGRTLLGETADTFFEQSGLRTGSSYVFYVTAVTPDGSSESSFSDSLQATCEQLAITPEAPETISGRATGDGEVTLTWSASEGATQYNVYYYRGEQRFAYLTSVTAESCVITGLPNGVTGYYMVYPVNKGSLGTFTGDPSPTVTVTARATPAAPTGVTARASGEGEITLRWTRSAGATQYNVYRYRGDQKKYVYIGTTQTNTYVATGLTGGTNYYFKVKAATKADGLTFVGPFADSVHAKAAATPAAPKNLTAAATGDGEITLNWTASARTTEYSVYRYRGDQKKYVCIGTSSTTSYVVTGLSTGTTYHFKVLAACQGDGLTLESPFSASAKTQAIGTPAVPTGLTAASAGDGRIALSWTKSSGATQYNIYRYNGTKKEFIYIGTSTSNSYTVSGLHVGTTYYFKVVAVTKGNGQTYVSAKSKSANAMA